MATFYFLFTLLPKQSNRQGGARAVDLPARSFDLARPGVAPPLIELQVIGEVRMNPAMQGFVMLDCAFAGIILVLTLGVALGVAVGVLMLSVVIAYMRR